VAVASSATSVAGVVTRRPPAGEAGRGAGRVRERSIVAVHDLPPPASHVRD
jgi:hypothetical protein